MISLLLKSNFQVSFETWCSVQKVDSDEWATAVQLLVYLNRNDAGVLMGS